MILKKAAVIFITFSLNIFAQYFSNISYPLYASKNSNFQVSFSGSFNDVNFDQTYLYLLIDDDIRLLNCKITTGDNFYQLPIHYEKNSYGNVNKVTLDKNLLTQISNLPFQILVNFKSGNITFTTIKYVWGGLDKKKRLVFNSSFIHSKNINVPNLINISFNDVGNKAGNSLAIKKDGTFNIPFFEDKRKIFIEFWAKNNSPNSKFSLIDQLKNTDIFSVSLSNLNFLQIDNRDDLFYDDYFIDKNNWYYYSILIDKNEKKASIYVNEKLFYQLDVSGEIKKEFVLKFSNKEGQGIVELDRLRIYSLDGGLEEAFKNKFSINKYLEDARLIYASDFDENNINKITAKEGIKATNCDIITSTAPLVNLSSEIEVKVFSGFYTITWENRDESTRNFILERSDNGNNYYEIYRVSSDGALGETFSYSDTKGSEGKVLFYRLKQLDKLGKVIYSSSVKVGVVEKQLFDVKPNFPNPFNPETEILVIMNDGAEVEITIYDITGKQVETLHNGFLSKGEHLFKFNGKDLPSGIYLCKVESGKMVKVQKMILTK